MQRIYTISAFHRCVTLACMAFLLGFVLMNLSATKLFDHGPPPLIWVFCAIVALFLLNPLTDRIILADDEIERRSLFKSGRLRFDDIGGWSVVENKGKGSSTYSLEIYPRDKSQNPTLKISSMIKIDADFKAWLLKLPNLTASPLLRRIKNSPKLAAKFETPEGQEKLAMLRQIKYFTEPEAMLARYFAQSGL